MQSWIAHLSNIEYGCTSIQTDELFQSSKEKQHFISSTYRKLLDFSITSVLLNADVHPHRAAQVDL